MPLSELLVTENFSGRTLSRCAPWKAQREFVVTGTFDPDEAVSGCGVAINDPWSSEFPTLKCEGPVLKESKGPDYHVVTAPYSQPSKGHFTDPTLDPLNRPKLISWQTCRLSRPMTVDLSGNTVINAAGQPITGGSIDVTYKQLTVIRNEPFYDVSKSTAYENMTNTDDMTVMGMPVKAGHLKCTEITPAQGEYEIDAEYLPIKYVFEIFFNDAAGNDPFDFTTPNVGSTGWYGSGPATGPLTNTNGDSLSDVPLDLDGKPNSEAGYGGVMVSGQTAVANPNAPTFFDVDSDDNNVFKLTFKACGRTDLDSLAL